ncbi:hypothetical protein J6590_076579 [Homalodisca vitripennis]|nr:hypothetical protein J6590_076579 [Homalodisca vitripennis]
MTAVNYRNYQIAQSKGKEVIQHAKKQGWIKLCTQISDTKSTTHAWKIVKKLKNNTSTHNHELYNNIDLAERFMSHIVPNYVPQNYEIKYPLINNSNHNLDSDYNMKELLNAIKTKKKNTAPGLDEDT